MMMVMMIEEEKIDSLIHLINDESEWRFYNKHPSHLNDESQCVSV